MIELILQPWPWYVSGPLITLVMFVLLWFGESFGVSSTLRTVCSIGGAGRLSEFFNFDWRAQTWNLVFVGGALLGGYVATNYLQNDASIALAENTRTQLMAWGFENPGSSFLPESLFSWSALFSWQGFLFMVVGGFFIGFGSRYAGGCTSGHAISGLSSLQLSSLFAVIGFFIGGLVMVYLIFPALFN